MSTSLAAPEFLTNHVPNKLLVTHHSWPFQGTNLSGLKLNNQNAKPAGEIYITRRRQNNPLMVKIYLLSDQIPCDKIKQPYAAYLGCELKTDLVFLLILHIICQ